MSVRAYPWTLALSKMKSGSDVTGAGTVAMPAFISPVALSKPQGSTTCLKCSNNPNKPMTRRAVLTQSLRSAALVLVGLSASGPGDDVRAADPPKQEQPETVCRNCSGSGKIPCDLCSGTGFWRALSAIDSKQRYRGVVCPECEGVGTLTCPVCLGTGEGKIRGLLRRRRIEPGPGRVLQSN